MKSLVTAPAKNQTQMKLHYPLFYSGNQPSSFGWCTPRIRASLCVQSHVSQYWPDTCGGLDLRQVDCHLATLSLMCAGLGLDQVRGSADGHLLLQPPSNVASACQHKRVVCVWLQLSDQPPLQGSLHFHALLVVQDLWAHRENVQLSF